MSAVVVTGDDELRAQIHQCAQHAGVYLTAHGDIDAALADWDGADLILLGGDLVADAAGRQLPKARHLFVLTANPADPAPWDSAPEAGAMFVALLPVARQWLTEQLVRIAGDGVTQLRQAGFRVGYTSREEADRRGYVWCTDLHDYPDSDDDALFVSLENVARGTCQAGQSSSVDRSNFRSLHRQFPGVFTDLSFSNVTALGAFACDLPPDLVDTVIGLKESDPLFDDSDHHDLEDEEIRESWSRWAADEVFGLLRQRTQDVWVALGDERVAELWWEVLGAVQYWPEHDGRDIHWDFSKLTGPFAARLMAEFRRTYRPDPAFTIIVKPSSSRDAGPRYAIRGAGAPWLLAYAWSRFAAKTLIWRHQALWHSQMGQQAAACPAAH